MSRHSSLRHLSLQFQPLPPCPFGEVTAAALFWDRGGTVSLDKLRRVASLNLLVVCLEGQSDYVDERGTRLLLRPGDVLLIPRGLAHSYRPTPGHGWSEIHAWLRGPLSDLWWSSRFLGPGVSVFHAEPLADSAQRLCYLFEKSNPGIRCGEQRLSGLQSWLATLKAHQSQSVLPRQPTWFPIACAELERGTLRQPDLHTLAGRLGVSYESFRKIFAAEAGLPPSRYRLAAVLQQACQLLQAGEMSLKEITAHLEFSDEFHFSRTFHQAIGMPPGQYRARGEGGADIQRSRSKKRKDRK